MEWLMRKTGFAVFIYLLSSTIYGYTGHMEFSIAGGAALDDFDNLKLLVTSTETDTLHQTNDSRSAFISTIGLGYDFLMGPDYSCRIHDILIGLNLYNVNLDNKGTVYQFENPSLNNYDYDLPVYTTRLMFDVKVAAPAWHDLMPYLTAGIGMSWNRASYQDYPSPEFVAPITLNSREQLKFAYEAGVGVKSPLTQAVSVHAEYLYANLGHARTSAYGNTQVLSAVSVPLHVNSFLIGFDYIF